METHICQGSSLPNRLPRPPEVPERSALAPSRQYPDADPILLELAELRQSGLLERDDLLPGLRGREPEASILEVDKGPSEFEDLPEPGSGPRDHGPQLLQTWEYAVKWDFLAEFQTTARTLQLAQVETQIPDYRASA